MGDAAASEGHREPADQDATLAPPPPIMRCTTGAQCSQQQAAAFDMDALNDMIEREIAARMRRQSWKQMDLCFKWKLVRAYMDAQPMSCGAELVADVRRMLKTDALTNVEYDGARVTRLNYLDM